MFWKHGPIQVLGGFEVAVNFELVSRRPLYVGTYDQIHFISFAPVLTNVSAEANCREGTPVKLTADIRLEIPKTNLAEVLKDSGYSTYQNIAKVSAQDVANRQNLPQSIKAAIQTFVRESPFFDLAKQQAVRTQLNQKIQSECARAKLTGEVISSDVVPVIPDPALLADLVARAKKDTSLAPIVEHFLEVLRQKELVQAEIERAKAEGERARVEAQQQMEKTRADLKIVQLEQEDRIATRQAELQAEELTRQQEAQERNAKIKETSAEYEFAYKTKRLEQDMELARKEVELAMVKEAEDTAARERKRLDMQMEVDRARLLTEIRTKERADGFSDVAKVVEKLKELPAADYHGVTTLVTGGTDSRDQVVHFLLTALARFMEGTASQDEMQQGNRKASEALPDSGVAQLRPR